MARLLSGALPDALPQLRSDLSYVSAGQGPDGNERWTIYDPIQHRYFRISEDVKQILSIWAAAGGSARLVETARSRLGLALDANTIGQISAFLDKCNLVERHGPDAHQEILGAMQDERNRQMGRLAGAAFYLKVPLLNPDRFLAAVSPLLGFVFTRAFWLVLLAAGAAGLFFGADDFVARFGEYQSRFFSSGMLQLVVAIAFLKIMHELGHAVTAHRFGCRVTSMGVAFMVFLPLLFTDVTDAWRLSDKRKRLLITAAGIFTELGLALAATFAWAFMIDGELREYVFYVAAIGWLSSLLFNLNPLLKFDGYYLLSDWLELENLQARAMAYGRWDYRRRLFGLHQAAPEEVNAKTGRIFLAYCYLSWVYRLILFTLISALIYAMLLKLVAIPLVILFFYFTVLRHVVSEAKTLMGAAGQLSARRTMAVLGGFFMLLGFLFVPWSSTVRVPAVLQLEDTHPVHSLVPAEIVAVHKRAGDRVRKGEPIIELSSPAIELAATRLGIEINGTRSSLEGSLVSNAARSERLLLENKLASLNDRLAELERQKEQLRHLAKADGVLLEVAEDIGPGIWVNEKKQLALLQFSTQQAVLGLVSEQDQWRLRQGSRGTFVPDDPTRTAVPVVLDRLSVDATKRVDIAELASVNEGPIAVEPQAEQGGHIARSAYHRAQFRPVKQQAGLNQTVTGTVLAKGLRQSYASRLWASISQILIREFGV